MKHIYTSLDIGSDSIKIIVCELYQNKLNILACSSYKSKGIKKGLITNVEDASISVKNAIESVENMIGIKITKVLATIPSYFAQFEVVKSQIQINGENNCVSYDDIQNVIDESIKDKLEDGYEMVTCIPVDFKVDEQSGIKDPINMNGNKLSFRGVLVSTQKKYIYSVTTLLENLGIEVVDISITGIGDINCFKNKKTSEGIGAIINIGSENTNVSLYNKDVLIKNSIINMGGKNINKDISYMYKTDMMLSEKLKLNFALAHKRNASTSDMYEIKTDVDDELKINQFEISEVVSSRLEEILVLAKKEINILTSKQIDYIIITGGTSNMADIEYIASDVFGRDVSIGNINVVGIRDNKYSSCIGNVIYFIDSLKVKGKDYSMVDNEDASKLASIRKSYQDISSEKMLENVMEYFLANRRI